MIRNAQCSKTLFFNINQNQIFLSYNKARESEHVFRKSQKGMQIEISTSLVWLFNDTKAYFYGNHSTLLKYPACANSYDNIMKWKGQCYWQLIENMYTYYPLHQCLHFFIKMMKK